MENELELTKKRLTELSRRAFERGIQTSSDFLSPGEQAEAVRLRLLLQHAVLLVFPVVLGCGKHDPHDRRLRLLGLLPAAARPKQRRRAQQEEYTSGKTFFLFLPHRRTSRFCITILPFLTSNCKQCASSAAAIQTKKHPGPRDEQIP